MPRGPCKFPGCPKLGGLISGYCTVHAPVAKQCIIDGCMGRVASWNKSGCCSMHVAEGRKLRP